MKKHVCLKNVDKEFMRYIPKTLLILFSALILCSSNAWAQTNTITGSVLEAGSNDPLIGVSVVVKGTTNGTVTDGDGKFSLTAPSNSTLVISYIGYIAQEINVGNKKSFDIKLQENTRLLDEVVVVGYGVTQRKNFTGSVAQVKMENSPLALLPTPNAFDALRGTATGITVSQEQGAGQSPTLLVRGQRSINGNNDPLIVLDGVIFMGGMRDIDPSTIENLSVLKDATSIAAYGSRAANGVIMITTKKGKQGKPIINFNTFFALSKMANKPDVLSPEDYIKKVNMIQGYAADADPLTWMSDFERENYKQGKTTDWVDLVSRTGQMQNYSLSVSGANEKVNYFVSASHANQKGVLIGDDFKRQAFVSRLKTNITSWLEIGTDIDYSFSDYSGATNYDIYQAIRLSPYARPYRTDGSGMLEKYPRQDGIYMINPLWNTQSGTIDDHDTFSSYRMGGNALVKLPWVEGLSYRLNYVYANEYVERDYFTHEGYYVSEYKGMPDNRYSPAATSKYLASANGYSARTRNQSWVMDNIVNYTKNFGKHFLDLTYVYTRDSYISRYKRMDGVDFASLGNTELGYNGLAYATTQRINGISSSKHNNIGYLGRVNYNYDSKYHFTASVRRDGSSVFGVDNKWGVFPAVGVAWTASSEEFLRDNKTIDYLKIRASWGRNGNQGLSPYRTLSTISLGQTGGYSYPFGNTSNVSWGQRLSSLGNTELGWEETSAFNTGFELGVLNNRISLNMDAYIARTTDQIFNRTIPVMASGITSILATMGRVDNWGIEATLNTTNIQTKDFTWNSSLIYYINRNKLVELYGDGKDDISNSLFIGKSLSAIYGYKPIGIVQTGDTEYITANNAQVGDVKFENTNGSEDGKITSDDRSILGYGKENFRMSLANSFTYKDFELYMLFTGVFGGGGYYMASNIYAYRTASDVLWDNNFNHEWWTPENQSNKYPRVNYTDNRYNPLQNRGFVRLQDVSLSYTFRQPWVKKMSINTLKVYATAKNLFTITNWEGGDPEISQTLGSGYNYGYPLATTYSFGVNITF